MNPNPVSLYRAHGRSSRAPSISAARPHKNRPLRLGLLGCGQVGQAVARALLREAETFAEHGLRPEPVAVLVRDPGRSRPGLGPAADAIGRILTADFEEFLAHRPDAVIEVLGGREPAEACVRRLLESGIPVVSANKTLLAASGPELHALADRHGVELRTEAAAVAGVPFLTILRARPLTARVSAICGILNGTCNYILTRLASGSRFDTALAEAQRLGFAEPKPEADLSGRDAAEKLNVILQHVGLKVPTAGIEQTSIANVTPDDLDLARRLGGTIRPVAQAVIGHERVEAFCGPAFVPRLHPFAEVNREQNCILLTSESFGTLSFSGRGAGPDVTAATIVDDLLELTTGRRRRSARLRRSGAVAWSEVCAPATEWFIRIRIRDEARGRLNIYEHFERRGLPLRDFVGGRPGHTGDWVGLRLGTCPRAVVAAAVAELEQADSSEALALRQVS